MDDIFYPDNSKRERRAEELSNDIQDLVHGLSEDAAKIKTTLQELDGTIRAMYQGIEVNVPPVKEYSYHDWVISVILGIQPSVEAIPNYLDMAGVSFLYTSGAITDKNLLSRIVGVPLFINLSGVGPIFSLLDVLGVFGEKRAQLRHAIHGCISSRVTIKKAAIINGMLASKLDAIKTSMDTLKKYGYTQEKLDEAQKKICDEFKIEVSHVTDKTAKDALAELDKNRGSWTNEDN